jgi:hypothetical protein
VDNGLVEPIGLLFEGLGEDELLVRRLCPQPPDPYRFISLTSWIQQKVAEFSKPMMALFDNLIAANLKKGDNIMFIMHHGV